MVEVSDKWKEKFNETLVPESFVEITCGITEPGINKKATIVTSSSAPFSTFHNIALSDNASISRYSTGGPISLFLMEAVASFLLLLRMELLFFERRDF